MAKKPKTAVSTIVLSAPTTIGLDKLVISPHNVRQIPPSDIDGLADSIARRGLLQSLSVRPELDASGEETGRYTVPGGGRRLAALQLLAKTKRLANDAPVPCIIKTTGLAEEDSLAENTDREDLHPLDQYRAFAALKAKGQGEETIAATFGVTAAVVRQRLRLAAASPKLLDAYAKDDLDLDQLMAFCVSDDTARQEQIFASIQEQPHLADEWHIRRLMTENTVASSDRRACFVGLEAYTAAGGVIIRDLFSEDTDEGYLQDPTLLNRLVEEKLAAVRDDLTAKGWKWATVALDIDYASKRGMTRVVPIDAEPSQEQVEHIENLEAELEELSSAEDAARLSKKQRAHMDAIQKEVDDFNARQITFAPEEMARAGVCASLDRSGELSFDYGLVRPEDNHAGSNPEAAGPSSDAATSDETHEPTSRALPDRVHQDLTSYRTVALRSAMAQNFDTAFLAVLHAMCLAQFHFAARASALQLTLNDAFPANAECLSTWPVTKALDALEQYWVGKLPRQEEKLWEALQAMSTDQRQDLFAYCASMGLNAVREPHNSRPATLRHADQLAIALDLDMAAAGWTSTVDNYFGRITKAKILEAVAEAKGENTAMLISHMKKPAMAQDAERLVANTGWLPEPLRKPQPTAPQSNDETATLPQFLETAEAVSA